MLGILHWDDVRRYTLLVKYIVSTKAIRGKGNKGKFNSNKGIVIKVDDTTQLK